MEVARHQFCVGLIAALLAFFHLGSTGLFDEDEPKNAVCAQEMFARGDWVVPTFNHDLRTDKPILLYWLMLVAYHLFGVNEFAARLTSATFSVGTALVVYHLGRKLYRPMVGLWAGVILSTSIMFDVVARAATPDSTFIFFCTLTVLCYVLAVPAWRRKDETAAARNWHDFVPPRWQATLPMYVAVGLAVLTKGPAGLVLPCGAIGLFLLVSRNPDAPTLKESGWRSRLASIWMWLRATFAPRAIIEVIKQMHPKAAIGIVGAVAAPWYLAVGIETNGAWLAGFLGKHNVGRFVQAMEGHRGPIFYYAIAIVVGFFPWSLFIGSCLSTWRARQRAATGAASDRFVACWAIFCIGLFSLAGTKLPNYVLPAYPALALLTAKMVADWFADPALIRRWQLMLGFGTLAGIGLAIVIAVPIAAHFVLPGEWLVGLVGLVPLLGGLGGIVLLRRELVRPSLLAFAATAVIQSGMIFGVCWAHVNRYQTSKSVIESAREEAPREPDFAVYDYFEPSLVFYAGQKVERLEKPTEVRAFFEANHHGCVITHEKFLNQLTPILPEAVRVVARKKRFLRTGDVVVLGHAVQVARRPGNSMR